MEVYLILFFFVNNIFLSIGDVSWECQRDCPKSCYDRGFYGTRKDTEINRCIKTQMSCGCARPEEDAARKKQNLIMAIALPVGFFVLVGTCCLITFIRVKYYKRDVSDPIVLQCACTDYIARRLGTLPPEQDPNTKSQHVSTLAYPTTAQPVAVISR